MPFLFDNRSKYLAAKTKKKECVESNIKGSDMSREYRIDFLLTQMIENGHPLQILKSKASRHKDSDCLSEKEKYKPLVCMR